MVGREVIINLERVEVERGKPVLEVKNLSAYSEKDHLALDDVSFKITREKYLVLQGFQEMDRRNWRMF